MPVLEKSIEAAIVKKIKKLGWKTRKMNGLGNRSWPDRLFITPEGQCIWVEFKREGGRLSEGQLAEIEDLRAFKQIVHVCYSVEEAVIALGI